MRSSHTRPHCATHKQLVRHNGLGQSCAGCQTWELHRLLLLLLNASCCVVLLQVVTFDAGGVSGHANHVSLHTAVRYRVCTPVWGPPWGAAGSAWCCCGAEPEPRAVFTASTEGQAVGHDTATALEITYSISQCSTSWDLASLTFTGPSLLFLSLIPLKYAPDHFALVL